MPLKVGKSKAAKSWNYRHMIAKGASRKQAVAVMLKQARKRKTKRKRRR